MASRVVSLQQLYTQVLHLFALSLSRSLSLFLSLFSAAISVVVSAGAPRGVCHSIHRRSFGDAVFSISQPPPPLPPPPPAPRYHLPEQLALSV